MKLLFAPSGRTDRRTFWVSLAIFAAFIMLTRSGLAQLDSTGATYFWLFPLWLLCLIQGTYAIYGKRLHDSGRSVMAVTALFVTMILILIVIMLSFGGADYFSDYSQYERKAVIDPEVRQAINDRYSKRLEEARPLTNALMSVILISFTLWVGTRKGNLNANRYGTPTHENQG